MANAREAANARAKIEKRQRDEVSREQLSLFLRQDLLVAGDMFFKTSRFQKSKKYHAELRGCTIGVFRNAHTARSEHVDIKAIVSVIVVPRYTIDVIKRDDAYPRIYLTSSSKNDETLMYIRVSGGAGELDAWCKGLARAHGTPLPKLEDLTIESVIGRGGGGKVFMVHWKENNTTYALKVIEKSQAFKSRKSFRHVTSERHLMESIGSHPFLLRIEFAFQTERNLFIGTPFCHGGDLASYIRANGDETLPCKKEDLAKMCLEDSKSKRIWGRLSEPQTRLIAAEVILGMEHLHSQGIIYRDLKPENIFIDSTGHIKIGDYGLAKHLDGNMSPLHFRSGSICGTRNYLPPEMLFGKMYSQQVDIWSLGVMMYRMLCAAFPFDAPRSKELFYKVGSTNPVLPPWLSSDSCKLLKRVLDKDPFHRPTIYSIKGEPFFRNLNWNDVYNLRAGESIPDIDIGLTPTDALGNFELSKLDGITVGEYLEADKETIEGENFNEVPTHLQDVSNMVIGFEYGYLEEKEKPAPLEVKHYSGGVFWKLTSNDPAVAAKSPRGILREPGQFSEYSGGTAGPTTPRH